MNDPTSPNLPFGDAELRVIAGLERWSRWVGVATILGASVGLAIVGWFGLVTLPQFGAEPTVLWLLGAGGGIAILVLWQGMMLHDAAKGFRELREAPFPGMVAEAFGKIGRYFAVDALLFWAPVVLLLLALVVAVPLGRLP